jgi:predicted O-linked N-acetylglucosamine transferase (SPINDLY family)
MRTPSDPVQELLALYRAGRVVDMEQGARRLLQTHPDAAVLHELLGIALSAQGRQDAALPHLEKAAALKPDEPQFHENLGLCQRQLRQFGAAERSLRNSLALKPDAAEAINALGSVLTSLDRIDEARRLFERAVALDPSHVGARFNLAKTVKGLGEAAAAEAELRKILEIDPANLPAIVALAELLHEPLQRRAEAKAMAERAMGLLQGRAISGAEDLPQLDALANVFGGVGEPARALEIFRLALGVAREPARALQAAYFARVLCEWDAAEDIERTALRVGDPDDPAPSMSPWYMVAIPGATPAHQLVAAQKYARPLAERVKPLRAKVSKAPRGKIRVGYLCANFSDHPTAHLLAEFFELHDRDRFEIVGYDASHGTDIYHQRISRAFDAVVPIQHMSNDAAAARIREDDVDILIDLDGWIAGHRAAVAARRPAPVQIQWLGFPGTLGASWIDYIIADPVLISPADEKFYQEKVIRLYVFYMAIEL